MITFDFDDTLTRSIWDKKQHLFEFSNKPNYDSFAWVDYACRRIRYYEIYERSHDPLTIKMSLNLSFYPNNWKELALKVKEFVGWQCAALRAQSGVQPTYVQNRTRCKVM